MKDAINKRSLAVEKKIQSIQFGLLSPSDIEKLAVCQITKIDSNDLIGNQNGLSDLRMGPTDKKQICQTCKSKKNDDCPGHFGYIKLEKAVYHVGFFDLIIKILKCICYHCHRLLIDDYDKYRELFKVKDPKQRQLKVFNLIKKRYVKKGKEKLIKVKCEERKPINANEKNYVPKNDPYYKTGCKNFQPIFKKSNLKIIMDTSNTNNESDMISEDENVTYIEPEKVLEIFSHISDNDLFLLGFDKKYCSPECLIIKNLIVCPPQVRPSVVESSLISQDDLTHQYKNILKCNEQLKKVLEKHANTTILQNEFDNLQLNIATLMKNDLSFAKTFKKNGQPIKSILDRLKGKEGRVRSNLMGKRVNFSARSVISPDPNIEVDEIGVPLSVAMNLTFPEVVTEFNYKRLKKLVENGPLKYPGANIAITKKGKKDLRIAKKIEVGDVVERHMLNGDFVIFNRQPSLHKMSMMGHRVHILPYSTFRLNLSVTTPYNADFDGDEMNLHFPQSLETVSEIKNIMHVPNQIVSTQSNKPVMGIVQDALIGCKVFTERDTFLTLDQVNNLVIWIKDFDIRKIPMPCIMKPKPLWSGKQIFSMILPKELNLETIREETPENLEDKLNLLDNFVQIKKGKLIQGIICKKTVGTSSGSIVHNIWKEISPQKALEFLGNCQKIINNYLLLKGWTVGIGDIICDSDIGSKISDIIKDMKATIKQKLNQAQLGQLECKPGKNMVESFEYEANMALNSAGQEAGKLIQNSLHSQNHLKNMVSSGSKGNSTNIMQIIAFAGQQNIEGQRIPFNFYRRTLPHFLKDDYNAESKGFIQNSFLKGLNPQEFFFHAMGGREGIIDTSVKTSTTGYIQRRLIKSLEDIMMQYDGTVRNSLGQITQFLYGDDGVSGEYIEDQKFETLLLDNETLKKDYKLFEKNESNNLFDELKLFLDDSVINELRNEDLNHILNELDNEYEQIKKDRDYVREHILKGLDNSIYMPLNINKIITFTENKYKINKFSKSNLNPLFALKKVKELKENLVLIKGTESTSFTLFNMVLNYNLSTKNIIIRHRLNKNAFEFICKEIRDKFEKAIVTPGEMVGAIATQSISEQSTQMTLNTFHLAGVSSANVTLGVPRLTEIINISKDIKSPRMMIFLKGKKKYEKKNIYKLIKKIEYTPLLSIVSLSEIYYDPDIRNTIITEDKEYIKDHLDFIMKENETIQENVSPWVLRIVLDKNFISPNFNIIDDIEITIKKLSKIGNILVIHSQGNADKRIIHIRFVKNSEANQEEQTNQISLDFLKLFEKYLLTEVSIYGINKIKKVYVKDIPKIEFDEITGKQVKIFKEKSNDKGEKEQVLETPEETVLETDGTNLSKIFEVEEVDFKRTISNDINDVYKVLGIEAVRTVLLHEIRSVLKPYDIYINYRHISILCDYMTQKGYLTSFTRYGLNKGGFGPIRKATFEETGKILLEAGVFSEKDKLKGVSENILIGNLCRLGTGSFDLLLDLEKLKKENINEGDNSLEKYLNSDNKENESQTPFIHHSLGNDYNSSPEYNPNSEYYNSQISDSPKANNGNNNVISPHNLMKSPFPQVYNKSMYSSYSPTTHGFIGSINNSPHFIEGTGSGIYNLSPNIQGLGNTSYYQPSSQNIYQASPNYNVKGFDNASPFVNKSDDEEEEEENENNDDEENKD